MEGILRRFILKPKNHNKSLNSQGWGQLLLPKAHSITRIVLSASMNQEAIDPSRSYQMPNDTHSASLALESTWNNQHIPWTMTINTLVSILEGKRLIPQEYYILFLCFQRVYFISSTSLLALLFHHINGLTQTSGEALVRPQPRPT